MELKKSAIEIIGGKMHVFGEIATCNDNDGDVDLIYESSLFSPSDRRLVLFEAFHFCINSICF